MANPQIADYVKKELKKGVSTAGIRSSLLSVGWSSYDIDEAISSASGSKIPKQGKIPAPSASYGRIGFFSSIKKGFQIFFLKGEAAEEVAFSDTTRNAILIVVIYGLLLALLLVFILSFMMSVFMAAMPGEVASGIQDLIGGFSLALLFIVPLFVLALAFAMAGFVHLFAKLFGGQAKYIEYFRATAHLYVISFVSLFLSIIPFLGSLLNFGIGILTLIAEIIILKRVHKLSTGRAILALFVPFLLIILILIIFFIIFFSAMMAQYAATAPLTRV